MPVMFSSKKCVSPSTFMTKYMVCLAEVSWHFVLTSSATSDNPLPPHTWVCDTPTPTPPPIASFEATTLVHASYTCYSVGHMACRRTQTITDCLTLPMNFNMICGTKEWLVQRLPMYTMNRNDGTHCIGVTVMAITLPIHVAHWHSKFLGHSYCRFEILKIKNTAWLGLLDWSTWSIFTMRRWGILGNSSHVIHNTYMNFLCTSMTPSHTLTFKIPTY